MVKRRRTKTRSVRSRSYRQVTRSRRSGNGGGGKFGGIFAGFVAGAGGTLLRGMDFVKGKYDNYAQPAADILSGHFMKERTLTVIGARSLGAALVSQMNPITAPSGGYAPLQ